MSQAPFMPLATDALVGDTLHLSAEEFGAYVLILLATWRNNGKPIKNDDRILSRICRVSERKWKANLKLLLLPFFDISDGYLHQKRLEKEWKRVANLSEIRRSVGKLGGRPKSLKNKDTSKAIAKLLGKQNESKMKAPIPIPLKEEEGRDSETPSENQNLRENAASRRNGAYAFCGKIVRLNQEHYDGWRKAYHGIADLDAALTTLDDYYDGKLEGQERGNWYIRCSKALEKEHQKALAARQAPTRQFTIGIG